MSQQKYAFQDYDEKTMARSYAKGAAISTKKTIELCSFIRGKKVKSVKTYLDRVLKMEDAVPYKRFNQEMAHHQRGPSGYPIKVVERMIILIDEVVANAKSKGLNTDSLKIVHLCANRADRRYHNGRQGRSAMKNTHLEIAVQEFSEKSKDVKKEKVVKTETKKESKSENSQSKTKIKEDNK